MLVPVQFCPARSRAGTPAAAKTAAGAWPTPQTLHGPYWSWTRKIDRKTVTRYLSDEEARAYEAWFDNANRLRDLLDELEEVGLRALEASSRPARRRGGAEPASSA